MAYYQLERAEWTKLPSHQVLISPKTPTSRLWDHPSADQRSRWSPCAGLNCSDNCPPGRGFRTESRSVLNGGWGCTAISQQGQLCVSVANSNASWRHDVMTVHCLPPLPGKQAWAQAVTFQVPLKPFWGWKLMGKGETLTPHLKVRDETRNSVSQWGIFGTHAKSIMS